jgi:hypothetical protein
MPLAIISRRHRDLKHLQDNHSRAAESTEQRNVSAQRQKGLSLIAGKIPSVPHLLCLQYTGTLQIHNLPKNNGRLASTKDGYPSKLAGA